MSASVATEGDLNAAILFADAAISGFQTIILSDSISLDAALDTNNLRPEVTLTIFGDPDGTTILDGGDVHCGLFVYAGRVTVRDLTTQHAAAVGGAGANRGGGAGRGGGLFLAGTNVGLSNRRHGDPEQRCFWPPALGDPRIALSCQVT